MLIPVVLSGGSGTRLWPLSRESHPKQFHAFNGSEFTLFQETLLRIRGLSAISISPPMVVCNANHRFMAAEQLQHLDIADASIILEPAARNTAPAATVAALMAIQRMDANCILLIMPSDHFIGDIPRFHAALQTAYKLTQEGVVCTFGIVPTRPETGFGYIEAPIANGDASRPRPARHFVEKPDETTAERYVHDGQHLWNSGIFMVRAQSWLDAIGRLHPAMLVACTQALKASATDLDFLRLQVDAYESCPADSIDCAVMEHITGHPECGLTCQVVPLDAGWSDLGSWNAIWQQSPKDGAGNAVEGNALLDDCRMSLVHSNSGRLVACMGLNQMAVIDTPDALLVAPAHRAQDIRRIADRLRKDGHPHIETHRKVQRPWGWYDSIDQGERFQVKRIVVKPGEGISLQMHHHRAEHWIVVSGTAEVTSGDRTFLLSENESTYIPLGHLHRLRNPGKVPLEIIEVQSGSYLGEDDIVRYEDNYGRS